jgi:hypothetical protein
MSVYQGNAYVTWGPGQTSTEDWVDLTFYGVRQDRATGHAYIDKIVAGSDIVRLPDTTVQMPSDYVNWDWTQNTFNWYWDPANTGRLIMEVF